MSRQMEWELWGIQTFAGDMIKKPKKTSRIQELDHACTQSTNEAERYAS